MIPLYKNIKKRRIKLKMSQDELAKKMGYADRSMIAKIEAGKVDITQSKIEQFAHVLQIVPGDLMGWENEEDGANGKNHAGYIRIPVFGRVAAGVPIEQIEDIEDYEDIKAPSDFEKDYFALRISGDSMQPLILDGSIVIVHKQPDAETGEVVIATVNGNDATCKRLKKYADGIMLLSINPAYDPIVLKNDDIENEPVRILGKVVEIRTSI